MNDNLQMNSDFTYGEYGGVSVTFGPPPIPGSVAITTINSVTGPTISFVGGSSGFTFSPAGTTIILASPLTTKGDILTRDGSTGIRLAVGSNGDVLTADSTTATGLKWAPASGTTPALNVVTITSVDSPYAVTDADDVILVDASGALVNVDLHSAATAKQKPYYIKLIDASGNGVKINSAVDLIDGAAFQGTIVQFVSFSVVPDNAAATWWIV